MREKTIVMAIFGVLIAIAYICLFGGIGATLAWLFGKDIMVGFMIGAAMPIIYFVWFCLMWFGFLYGLLKR